MKCLQCKDTGKYSVAKFGGGRSVQVEQYCNCSFGEDLKELDERLADPNYVNPFAAMTDDEIIAAISETKYPYTY